MDTIKIESLHQFLAENHLEVVRAEWGPGGAYPVLLVRPASPPPMQPCGYCGHVEALHENFTDECMAYGCVCEVWTPPLEEN